LDDDLSHGESTGKQHKIVIYFATCDSPDLPNNPQIKRGMVLKTFGKTLEHQPDHVPLFLCAFACMVWHSDELIAQMVRCPGHDFSKLAILHDRELLAALKDLVTLAPTEGVVAVATGIPSHVNMMRLITGCLENVGCLVSAVRNQGTELVGEMKTFLETRAWESGSITSDRLEAMLKSYKDDMIKALDVKLLDLKTHIMHVNGGRTLGRPLTKQLLDMRIWTLKK
jgi:hypothetical protein